MQIHLAKKRRVSLTVSCRDEPEFQMRISKSSYQDYQRFHLLNSSWDVMVSAVICLGMPKCRWRNSVIPEMGIPRRAE